jgi:hypothetical protein
VLQPPFSTDCMKINKQLEYERVLAVPLNPTEHYREKEALPQLQRASQVLL